MKELRHRIYTGTFEALESKYKDTIDELQCDDPLFEVTVLAGSNILASYLRRRLAESGRSAANIRFYNFPDLVRNIMSAPVFTRGIDSSRPAFPSLGSVVLLESLLEDRVNLPKAYAPLSGYKGFRNALLETFRDLRDADIDADKLDGAIASGRRAADRREQLENFASLYRRYRELTRRFCDTDDDFRAAIKILSQAPEAGNTAPILVYGVYDATWLQTRLLDALGQTRRMIYFIPFVNAAVSEFARTFLDARASNSGAAPVHIVPPVKTDSLGRLAERNFGFSREPIRRAALNADDSFALVSAPGESRAAVEVVREIIRAVRDGVISGFNEAAVIFRQPESDIPILSEALRLRKIPYYIHGGEKFLNRPACKAVLAINGLETADFSREAILDAVEFIGAALPEAEAGKWDVENWRASTREAESLTGAGVWDTVVRNILRRAYKAARRLEQTPETKPEELSAARKRLEDARCLRQNWRKLKSMSADRPDSASFAEWAKFLRQSFRKILKTSPDWTHLSSVFDGIAELETLAQADSQNAKYGICSAAKIRSLLDEAVQSLTYPSGRFQRGGVNILGVSAARGLRFPLVVIPGLDEGSFPSRMRQDPLLPDAERRRLGNLPLRGARAEEEKLLFDMAARSAEKRLVLITSRLDESADREKFPSPFFLRAASAASGGRVAIDNFQAENIPGFRSVGLDADAPPSGITAIDEGEIRLRWITSGKLSASRALEELAVMEPRRLRLPLEYELSRRKNRLTKFDGLISDPRLIEWMRQKPESGSGQMSASRFENYAKCPYSFFLKHVLKLRILEDERGMTESMDPMERGTAVHAALESFLKNHASEGFISASYERLRTALEYEARRALEKKRPVGMPDMLWEIECDGLLALLQNWLKFETARGGADMRILELAFENFAVLPPHFEFCGRIDRVDISADGKQARVIDYKIGKLPDALKKKDCPLLMGGLMGGEKIQLAVYSGALRALNEFAAVESVEAEYLHLQPKDGEVGRIALTPDKLDAARADLPRVLQILDSCMKNGVFFARGHSAVYPNGHCEHCDFLPICGKDQQWREKLKNNDPAIQKFMETAKIREPQKTS